MEMLSQPQLKIRRSQKSHQSKIRWPRLWTRWLSKKSNRMPKDVTNTFSTTTVRLGTSSAKHSTHKPKIMLSRPTPRTWPFQTEIPFQAHTDTNTCYFSRSFKEKVNYLLFYSEPTLPWTTLLYLQNYVYTRLKQHSRYESLLFTAGGNYLHKHSSIFLLWYICVIWIVLSEKRLKLL